MSRVVASCISRLVQATRSRGLASERAGACGVGTTTSQRAHASTGQKPRKRRHSTRDSTRRQAISGGSHSTATRPPTDGEADRRTDEFELQRRGENDDGQHRQHHLCARQTNRAETGKSQKHTRKDGQRGGGRVDSRINNSDTARHAKGSGGRGDRGQSKAAGRRRTRESFQPLMKAMMMPTASIVRTEKSWPSCAAVRPAVTE